MAKFLDLTGVTQLWNATKKYADDLNTKAGEAILAAKEAAVSAAAEDAAAKVNALADGAVKSNTAAIEVLNGAGEGSVAKAVADAVATAHGTLDTDVANVKSAVKTLTGDKTVEGSVDYKIDQAHHAAAADVEALSEKVDSLFDKEASEGVEAADGVIRTIAKAEATTAASAAVAKVIDGAPEKFDTLKELAAWIEDDKTGAKALADKVDTNNAAIEVLNGTGTGSVAKAVADAIDAIDYSDYATVSALEEVDNKIKTLNADKAVIGSIDYKIDRALDGIEKDTALTAEDIAAAIAPKTEGGSDSSEGAQEPVA